MVEARYAIIRHEVCELRGGADSRNRVVCLRYCRRRKVPGRMLLRLTRKGKKMREKRRYEDKTICCMVNGV